MKQAEIRQLDPSVIAVVHHADARWSVLVASLAGQRPKILETRRFSETEVDAIARWLDLHNVSEAIAVLPASRVICRTVPLPQMTEDQLVQALHLQAEAHLLGVAEPHRTAMAVLPANKQDTGRKGLVTAWPNEAVVDMPDLDRPTLFAADVVGLAALLDDRRPADPMLWMDRVSGAVAIAISQEQGPVLRATREESADDVDWRQSILRVLAETAMNAGHDSSHVDSMVGSAQQRLEMIAADEPSLSMPAEVLESARERINGAKSDASWWSEFGVAAGIVLARAGSLRELTQLQRTPPARKQSIIFQTVEKLTTWRAAAAAVLVAIAVLALAPTVFSGLRLLTLKMKYPDMEDRLTQLEQVELQLALYEELTDSAWPMTKLLADVTNSAPIGIELELIRITQGDTISIKGNASPRNELSANELVSLMQTRLHESGIFNSVRFSISDRTSFNQYEFDMNAQISQPHHRPRYPEEWDFGLWTHDERINDIPRPSVRNGDGEETLAGTPDGVGTVDPGSRSEDQGDPQVAVGADDQTRPDSETSNNGDNAQESDINDSRTADASGDDRNDDSRESRIRDVDRGTRPDGAGNVRGSGSGPTIAHDPPPVLTSEQIAQIPTKQETLEALGKVARYTQGARLDEEQQAIYKEQRDLLWEHLRSFNE